MPLDRQTVESFASGELDPLLWSREQISMFYSSARVIANAIPLPQGGAKRGEGLRFADVQRGDMATVDVSGYTFTAPNGGTAGNADSTDSASQLETSTNISTTTEYIIVRFDAGSAVRVSTLRLNPVLVGGTIETGTLALQSSDDDAAWTTRATMVIGTTQYERTFALSPDSDLGTHRYWRVILDNSGAANYGTDTINVFNLAVFQEDGYSQASAEPGAAALRRITVDVNTEFWAIITQGNVDLFSLTGTWLAAVTIPHSEASILDIKFAQQLDTLVLYHPDFHPYVVQRLGADAQWRSGEFAFSSIEQFPFEDSTSGGQSERQELSFSSFTAGDRIVFEYNGDVSNEVVWNATAATNASNMETAIEGLTDITSVSVTVVSGNTNFLVSFTGEDARTPFAILVVTVLQGSGTVQVLRQQFGRPRQEDLWSATRGYPACGAFFGGRHWMGGFKGRPGYFSGSRVNDFTAFRADADPVASSPVSGEIVGDEAVEIEAIFAGRNLQIFTTGGEHFFPSGAITPDNVTDLQEAEQNGHYQFTQPVDVQGATLFVDRNGNSIREFIFSELQQSYTAEPVSTLANHLVKQPVAMAYRRSSDEDEPPLLYLVNTGRDRNNVLAPSLAIATINRAQEVTAFVRRTTTGTFKSVAASQQGTAAVLCERSLAGNVWNFLEIFDADLMSDVAVEIANTQGETFTATASQTVFTYTFTSPIETDDVGVFTRVDASDTWMIAEPSEYTVDLGAKTVTFTTGRAVGTQVYLAPREETAALGHNYLDGVEAFVHVDGIAAGAATPAAGSVAIPADEGFFFHARIGLRMVPSITLHPYKGKGGMSPTMKKQRIPRALLSLERTTSVAIATEGVTPREVALTDHDSGQFDKTLEEIVFTGTKRVSGMGGWQTEPRLVITQNTPGPWLVRSLNYDVRF